MKDCTSTMLDHSRVPVVSGYKIDTVAYVHHCGGAPRFLCLFQGNNLADRVVGEGESWEVVDVDGEVVEDNQGIVLPLEYIVELLKEHGLV